MAALFRNRSKTCIVVSENKGLIEFIPLMDIGLEIDCIEKEEFVKLGWVPDDYSIEVAAERYLKFGELHGCTQEALEELIKVARKGESPVNERRVYSDGSMALINVSPIDGPNINFVGILNGKLDIIPLSQKEFKKFKELKNQVKDFAKKLMEFAKLEGTANKQAPRLLQEIIKGGPLINFEKGSEMARKKVEPVVEKVVKPAKAEKGKSLMAEKKNSANTTKAGEAGEVGENGSSRGRKSKYAGLKIKVLSRENPSKEGTGRHAAFEALFASKEVDTYLANGFKSKYLERAREAGLIDIL